MPSLADRLADRELIQRGDLTLSYKARDRVLDRPVFVKLLNPALSADAEIRARFEREARAVARLDHPNLVRIYEYGDDPDEGLYMVLEWIEGRTLTAQLNTGTISGAEWLRLARELLAGLAGLHSVAILHRDLKPDNILVRATGDEPVYKITDFSLAALRDAPRLTHHEAIVGTPAYMAPETAAGGSYEERSDLFSLGVVLYEAATGENPFAGTTLLETLRNIRERAVPLTHPALLALPEKGRELLAHLLEKDMDQRPASARAALGILGEKYLPPHYRPRTRKRDLIHFTLALIVIAVWALLIFRWPWGKKSAPPVTSTSPAETTAVSPPPVTEVRDTLPASSAHSEPELRAPVTTPREPQFVAPSTDTSHTDTTAMVSTTPVLPDSADLYLVTEPWADVYWNGEKLGTTPLSAPLRLPSGRQTLVLRNPAFPPVSRSLDLNAASLHDEVRLAEHAALLRVTVQPWGELYVDGEHVGATPLPQPLFVAAGRHTLRVSHPQLPPLEHVFQSAAGETLSVQVDLAHARAHVSKLSARTTP